MGVGGCMMPPPTPMGNPQTQQPPTNDIVILNCSGFRYETYKVTLKKFQATRLSRLSKDSGNFDPARNEYFFDRHPGVFAQVLNYYRTGELHYPKDVCGSLFEKELAYWGIDANEVENCCWITYMEHKETLKTLRELDDLERNSDLSTNSESAKEIAYDDVVYTGHKSWWKKTKQRIWSAFNEPSSSTVAKIVRWISIAFISISIGSFLLKTATDLPDQSISRDLDLEEHERDHGDLPKVDEKLGAVNIEPLGDHLNPTVWCPFITAGGKKIWNNISYYELLSSVDILCITWFTIELLIKFISCPTIIIFLKSLVNMFDIAATFSFYIQYLDIKLIEPFNNLLNLIVLLRLARLAGYFTGLKVLMQTLMASLNELLLMLFFFILSIIVFASLVYYAEKDSQNPSDSTNISNIPKGLWWALVTMTAVGYGDVVPKTNLGMLIGSVCALCGVLAVSLPVSVIVSNFVMYYTHSQARAKCSNMPNIKRIPSNTEKIKSGTMNGDCIKVNMDNLFGRYASDSYRRDSGISACSSTTTNSRTGISSSIKTELSELTEMSSPSTPRGLLQPTSPSTPGGGLLQPTSPSTPGGGLLQPISPSTPGGGLLQPTFPRDLVFGYRSVRTWSPARNSW